MKTCSKCNVEKINEDFPKIGLQCKSCIKIYRLKYNLDHKKELSESDKLYYNLNKDSQKENKKIYRDNHKIEKREYDKKYREENKDKLQEYEAGRKEQNKLYREENKDKILQYNDEYRKNRSINDPAYAFRLIISSSIRKQLRLIGCGKQGLSFLDNVGYTMQDFIEHIERQFLEPGNEWMNWQNHGKYKWREWDDNNTATWKWQLDHIIPHSTFQYTSMEDQSFRDCWALSNLRPLSAKQNLLDGVNRIRHVDKTKTGPVDKIEPIYIFRNSK